MAQGLQEYSTQELSCRAEERRDGTSACPQGMRVLELGCGCGLVGLVFAALGACVLLTDLAETQARCKPHLLCLQDELPRVLLYSWT